MTSEQWAGVAVSIIVALGGGAGIAQLLKWSKAPAKRTTSSIAPPPLMQPHATREELAAMRAELKDAIEEVENALRLAEETMRSRLDDSVRDLIDRMHALAIKVERVLAVHSREDIEPRESRRGGRR